MIVNGMEFLEKEIMPGQDRRLTESLSCVINDDIVMLTELILLFLCFGIFMFSGGQQSHL